LKDKQRVKVKNVSFFVSEELQEKVEEPFFEPEKVMEVQKIKEFDVGVVQEVVQSLIQPKKEAYDVFERLEEINSEDEINPQ
jgi:hypothetical protein